MIGKNALNLQVNLFFFSEADENGSIKSHRLELRVQWSIRHFYLHSKCSVTNSYQFFLFPAPQRLKISTKEEKKNVNEVSMLSGPELTAQIYFAKVQKKKQCICVVRTQTSCLSPFVNTLFLPKDDLFLPQVPLSLFLLSVLFICGLLNLSTFCPPLITCLKYV